MRTHYCGQVGESLIGQVVTVAGWAHRRRDHGGVIFVDLRDREGLLQIVFDPDRAAVFALAERVRNEYVLKVTGLVRVRPGGTANVHLKSGQVELLCHELEILNRSDPLPFQLDEHVSEEVRLRFRYLDLRREEMRDRLLLRHRITRAMRHYLTTRDSSISRRRCSRRPRRRARATTWCRAALTPANSSRCPNRRRSTSSC